MKPAVFVLCAMTASCAAFAGQSGNHKVFIYDADKFAFGTTAGARSDPDPTQSIGCSLFSALGQVEGTCNAVANGNLRMCVTRDQTHLAAIASVTSESRIAFTWDSTGACASVRISSGSSYLR